MRLIIKATSESNPVNNPNEDEDQSRGCRISPPRGPSIYYVSIILTFFWTTYPPTLYESIITVLNALLNVRNLDPPIHPDYSNTGCGDFRLGVKNQKDFCLRLNVLKGNDWILRIRLMGRCQKVPKFDFQSQFSMSKIIWIFLNLLSYKNIKNIIFFIDIFW